MIDKEIKRSRIRHHHTASNIESFPGAMGLLSFPKSTTQLSFFISSWHLSRRTIHSIFNDIYQLSLLIKQSGEVESDIPIILSILNLCLVERVYCPFQKGLTNFLSLSHPDVWANLLRPVSQPNKLTVNPHYWSSKQTGNHPLSWADSQ